MLASTFHLCQTAHLPPLSHSVLNNKILRILYQLHVLVATFICQLFHDFHRFKSCKPTTTTTTTTTTTPTTTTTKKKRTHLVVSIFLTQFQVAKVISSKSFRKGLPKKKSGSLPNYRRCFFSLNVSHCVVKYQLKRPW